MSEETYTPNTVLIATLDVLGITQLMQRGKPEALNVIASKIKSAFENAMTGTNRAIKEIFGETKAPDALQKIILDHIFNPAVKFHDFSDTIVISCDISHVDADAVKKALKKGEDMDAGVKLAVNTAVILFGVQVLYSYNALLREGFPVRGCVDAGAVYLSEKLVVGRPYVNSLHIGEALDFFGIVITNDALDFCKKHEEDGMGVSVFDVIDLYVPLKSRDGRIEYSLQKCLNWLVPGDPYASKQFNENQDWRQFLYEKFAANGKSMTESALRKLANTENTVRAFIMHNKEAKKTKKDK